MVFFVSAEALVDGLWAEEWSPSREKNLHTLVYQLRRRLAALEPGGKARLVRAGAGYRLVLGPRKLDTAMFWDLARWPGSWPGWWQHFRRAGDLNGQGWAHQIAALAYAMMGDWAESAAQSELALALFRQAGDQTGQAWVTATIGEYYVRLGNYDLGRGYARQALEGSATGESTSLAIAWDALGVAHFQLGEPREAIGCFLRGLALVRDLKNPLARLMTAIMLAGFGDASLAAGDLPAAVRAWHQALQVLDDLGWPDLLGIGARLEQAGHPGEPG